jgi:uncharacterized membrane protein
LPVNKLVNKLAWAGTILALIGFGLSLYLTIAHYTTPEILSCAENSIVNCAKVTTSSYATILGIPVALLGLLYYVAMIPMQLPIAWRNKSVALKRVRLASAAIGIVMILWLIYVELFKLNAICLYCTGVHIITVLLFVTTALATAASNQEIKQ